MDDFGVLVQNFGIKPQGKSAPMASSKASTTQNYTNVNVDPSFGAKPYSSNSISGTGSFLDDQNDDIFGLNSSNKGYNNYASSNVFDDVFHIPTNNTSSTSGGGGGGGGGGFDFDVESMFKGSMNLNKSNSNSDVGDDLIWGFSEKKSSNVVFGTDDLLSSDPVDDFLGKLGKLGSDQRGSKGVNSIQNEVNTDELIPGFGRTNAANNRAQAASTEKSSGLSSLEELEDFATGRTNKVAKGHVNNISIKKEVKKPVSNRSMEANFIDIEGSLVGDRVQADLPEKTSGLSSLEEFEDFATSKTSKIPKGRVNGIPTKKEVKKTVSNKTKEANFIDIEGSFSGDYVDSNKAGKMGEPLFPAEGPDLDNFFKPCSKKSVPVTEDTFMNTKSDGVSDLFPETKFKKENKVSPKDLPDAFSSIFEAAPVSGEFEEREGESDERRRIRYESYLRAKARMGEALANLNEREYQAQQERDERHRIAESMETEMKRWAAGKEGNLRALLSSLEQVLAPELGWRPVTLTDLITSSQVKVAYKRAALCVHPDKVQQKGASLQQKYVAEKAFDLLKEAWNKFNTEELR